MKYFITFCIYILLKYTLLFGYDFIFGDASWDWNNLKTGEDWFYIGWMFFVLPLLEILVLYFPFRIALKQSGSSLYIGLAIVFIVEFFISWVITSQRVEGWMIAKIVLSIILFMIMFRGQLRII